MTEIRQLDPKTVERIAAGEVVERPASVVKELVENSLDAGADRVEVAVDAGGTEGIRVTDDGSGMSESELRRAVEKHTTSKIADIADLEGGVGTLGFRGEALHAIGAVSRLTIRSRPRGAQAAGTELVVEGGKVTGVESAGCPAGTTVEVRDLFYNVPARRKYLKQEATEFAHVNTVVSSYALANPGVAVSLSHGGRETFATTGRGGRRETVMSVYGREVAESMVSLEEDALPEGPLDGITGLVSNPETNRASRDYLSTFVNGRYVTASAVQDAIVEGYDTQLASDRYPFAVLDLSVDPATVDVNVHPRKLEVRFADDEAIREQVRTVVEETLLADGLVRSSAPRGRSAAEQTEIRPASADSPVQSDEETDTQSPRAAGNAEPQNRQEARSEQPTQKRTSIRGRSRRKRISSDSESRPEQDVATGEVAPEEGGGGSTLSREGDNSARRKFTPSYDQTRLDADGPQSREFDRLPSMRILGQLHDTYVVAQTAEGLVLVDQHAADERIHYERLQSEMAGETTTQALADPVAVEVTPREADLFDAHAEALDSLGFVTERIDDQTVKLRAVPSLVAETADPELLRDVLSEFVTGEVSAAETVKAAADDLLADLACYPSITGNTSLSEGSVVDLLERLDDCENPYACPHGRPVIVEFAADEIEARFERDYPGHGE